MTFIRALSVKKALHVCGNLVNTGRNLWDTKLLLHGKRKVAFFPHPRATSRVGTQTCLACLVHEGFNNVQRF